MDDDAPTGLAEGAGDEGSSEGSIDEESAGLS